MINCNDERISVVGNSAQHETLMIIQHKHWFWKHRKVFLRFHIVEIVIRGCVRLMSRCMHYMPFQTWRTRNRKCVYLHVGCGSNIRPEFINLDYRWYPGVDLVWDIARPLPIASESLTGIFTEHCLEHLSHEVLEKCVFQEFVRCLRPGGIARIVVPDAGLFLRLYNQAMSGQQVSFPMDGKRFATAMMYVNEIFRGFGHRYAYDFPTLKHMLAVAGFAGIRQVSFQEGNDPCLLIDLHEHVAESLYVEAMKPNTTTDVL